VSASILRCSAHDEPGCVLLTDNSSGKLTALNKR
jgi:hypothetical protein